MAKNEDNFKFIKSFFDQRDWYYTEKDLGDDDYLIESGLNGDNINFDFVILLSQGDVYYRASLPMKFGKEALLEILIKINKINSELIYGYFWYDFEKNMVYYSYRYLTDDIELNDELVLNIVFRSCSMIDKYAKDIIQFA